MIKRAIILQIFILLLSACNQEKHGNLTGKLEISDNHRYIMNEDGSPFFWLGDTGWLLFIKLNREEAEDYFKNRRLKGFNVVQVMVIHDVNRAVNIYGDSALIDNDISRPLVTAGKSFNIPDQYDFWDHVDYLIDLAAEKGIYMAMVPVWGSNVKKGFVSIQQARTYAGWLADRYKNKSNIIWVNGGDIQGSDTIDVWNAIGYTLWEKDPGHLVTFHPRGRTQSSWWYHDEIWLDFNMFQSGHRRYDQDDTKLHYGEDNWRYVDADYHLVPVKPTLDGEPSYEAIPQGLHDTLQPYWTADDVRRYAYWSVFAGACGFTYGNNAVMQFFKPDDGKGAYGVKKYWYQGMNDPGAGQMIYLKDLMLSRPYFERIPDQSLIAEQGEKYDHLEATRGRNYAFIYSYTGGIMKINMDKLSGKKIQASWFCPKDGSIKQLGVFPGKGIVEFDPPGSKKNGNDWVLILDSV